MTVMTAIKTMTVTTINNDKTDSNNDHNDGSNTQ